MTYQLDIFGNEHKVLQKPTNKAKRNWENAFQRWSDRKGFDAPTETYGKCGYGAMCGYCEDNSYGRPCVRALNKMCREERITIDYDNRNFEEIWDGDYRPKPAPEIAPETQTPQE